MNLCRLFEVYELFAQTSTDKHIRKFIDITGIIPFDHELSQKITEAKMPYEVASDYLNGLKICTEETGAKYIKLPSSALGRISACSAIIGLPLPRINKNEILLGRNIPTWALVQGHLEHNCTPKPGMKTGMLLEAFNDRSAKFITDAGVKVAPKRLVDIASQNYTGTNIIEIFASYFDELTGELNITVTAEQILPLFVALSAFAGISGTPLPSLSDDKILLSGNMPINNALSVIAHYGGEIN